jgi:hypothetical protein
MKNLTCIRLLFPHELTFQFKRLVYDKTGILLPVFFAMYACLAKQNVNVWKSGFS